MFNVSVWWLMFCLMFAFAAGNGDISTVGCIGNHRAMRQEDGERRREAEKGGGGKERDEMERGGR
jgi:hypothetical protein